MYNFLDIVKDSPVYYRQLAVDDQLITEFNCPLETKKADMWSNQGYFAYVIDGKKIWHVPGKSFELTPGKCIFVKKGAHIVEQFFDARFCVVFFFVSDDFIKDVMRAHASSKTSINKTESEHAIDHIDADDTLHAFFNSVVPYFLNNKDTNKALLELKFRELILNVVNNPGNHATTNYFHSLLTDSSVEGMRKIMEENYYYNLGIPEFARLCNRSLSAFKRDFEEHFNTTPGKWLLSRRLQYAQILVNTSDKSVSEIAFECGFENASHFSRAFKQQFGNSPVHTRKIVS